MNIFIDFLINFFGVKSFLINFLLDKKKILFLERNIRMHSLKESKLDGFLNQFSLGKMHLSERLSSPNPFFRKVLTKIDFLLLT